MGPQSCPILPLRIPRRGSRARWAVAAALAMSSLTLVSPTASRAASPADAATVLNMYWPMDEGPGAAVMVESTGTGPDGEIGDEVTTGVAFEGATSYRFPWLHPNEPPAHPEHLVRIPDAASINPDDDTFSVEVRYQTTHRFGNLIQKGQGTTPGGQFKIQLPRGEPQCSYRGSLGGVGIRWHTPINDGHWHTLRCVRTATAVTLYVDGIERRQKLGMTGTLHNSYPMTIAGKPKCDQIEVTCDYFVGQVDYVKITKGEE